MDATAFGDNMEKTEEKKINYTTSKVDEFFANFPKDKIVSYKDYWESVKPQNHDDIFRR